VIALRLVLTAAARKDIAEAQDWYRREGLALAASFREEPDRQFARVGRLLCLGGGACNKSHDPY
jgi:hypothetical protein